MNGSTDSDRIERLSRIDRQLFGQFWSIAKLYWFSEKKWQARGWLALLLVLLVSFTLMNIVLNFVGRDFMTALSEKNAPQFWRMTAIYLGVFVVAIPVRTFFNWVRDRLGILWRDWLTQHFLDRYMQNQAYYGINSNVKIDNPDQRISEDINAFTVSSLRFLTLICFSASQLIAFSGILWSISVPLVLVLIAYAAIGTIGTIWFGRRLVGLNFNQLQQEANFRYGLVHVRDNAEAIAFYRGEQQESGQLRRRFDRVVSNFNSLINWQRNLEFFTNAYDFLIGVVPFVVMAPLYFQGQVPFGVVTQANSAFNQVLNALSLIVVQFQSISQFAAGIKRLASFSEALDNPLPQQPTPDGIMPPTIDTTINSSLSLNRLTLMTPDYQQTLVRDLSVSMQPQEGLLIMGQSGSGKSSLLRSIAGLWKAGTGLVIRPDVEDMMFLPQRPYMILGTLRAQLLYPKTDSQIGEDKLRDALRRVNLEHLPERVGGFDVERDWSNFLSLGEQQRLAIARLLLTSPQYAILDEATSALDAKNEELIYEQIRDTATVYVSVGHRLSLLKHHQKVLKLDGESNWELVPAKDFKPDGNVFA